MSKTPTKLDGSASVVRSRPRLPTNIVGTPTEKGDIDDIVGVLTSLGNTDFVRKYSRKHRGSLSDTTSPTPSLPCSLPMSPSGVMSPVTGSKGAGITLTRMRSIRVKLEKVKENRDRVEALKNESSTDAEYSTATLTRRNVKKYRNISPDCDSESSTDTTNTTDSGACKKTNNVQPDDIHSISSGRRTGTIEAPYLSLMSSEGCILSVDSTGLLATDKQTGNTSDNSYADDGKKECHTEKSSDEKIGQLDTSKSSNKLVCGQYKSLERDKVDEYCDSELSDTTDNSTLKLQSESQSKKHVRQDFCKITNGRFLTHPPFRERVVSKELGSVDSNGLGSLRECSDGYIPDTSELKSHERVVSADSNIGPSDTNDGPSYRDVVLDVTTDSKSVGKFERRNGKSLKYKSKSDPSGKKNKISSNVEIPKSLQVHAHSVPVFDSCKTSETQRDVQSSDDDKRKGKSENRLMTPHIQELRSSNLMRSTTSEESSEEYQTNVPSRKRSTKKKSHDSDFSEDGSRSEISPAGSPVLSSTAPSSPRLSTTGRTFNTGINSLTLPSRKTAFLSRSHSSVSVLSRDKLKTLPAKSKSRPKLPDKLTLSSSYCPRLEPIFSGSSLSLLEGSSEDTLRVSSYL